MVDIRWSVAAVLLQLCYAVVAHDQDEHNGENMDGMKMGAKHSNKPEDLPEWYTMPSYSGLSEHSGMMLAHIILMVLAWFFVLPIGVVLSVSRSRYTIPIQFLFLVLNGVGVICSTIYNVSTPDLYENNAHHTIGWIATWVFTAQVLMSLLFLYSGRSKTAAPSSAEQAAFLPGSSTDAIVEQPMSPYYDYRWSGDSGQGTERSSIQNSRDASPTDPHRYVKPEPQSGDDGDDDDDEGLPMPMPMRAPGPPRSSLFRIRVVDKFLTRRVPGVVSAKLLNSIEATYEIIDRTILILGWIALTSGGVTYAGIFRGNNIFNGLAHFIKGGIFFWYGLLTLGRWMGCFADLGWAWNIKPSRGQVGQWKARIPSAEFVESFVIFLYGSINVFLEHLAAWGHEWVAQDLEHVSISIMFFGGGLAGMLVESKKVRQWLNASLDTLPTRNDLHPAEAQLVQQPPRTYNHSLNPMPALIIMLLGIMMSSHHQDSMVSTTVHKQWGSLLVGFSIARGFTYILTYISPPTSMYPSRPPTELVSSFCLISGGLTFMASNKDIVLCMEERNLMAMFVFTVMMGFTAFIMAYEIIVMMIKGWASRREQKLTPKF